MGALRPAPETQGQRLEGEGIEARQWILSVFGKQQRLFPLGLRLVQQGLLMAMNAGLPGLKLGGCDCQRFRQLGAAGRWCGALLGIAGAK